MISRTEIGVLVGGLSVIAAVSLVMFYEGRQAQEESAPVGVITFRYKVAQRRSASRVIWEDVEPGSNVFNNNFVRTDRESEAVVQLANGTRIELDPDSMVVLQLQGDRAEISFERGSIVVRGSDGVGQTLLKTKHGTVGLQQGSARLTVAKDALQIAATSGSVNWQQGQHSQRIEPGVRATISASGVSRARLLLAQALPEDNHKFFSVQPSVEVQFSFGNASVLQVASSRDFSDLLRSVSSPDGSAKLTFAPGIYYWRTVRNGEGSEVRKFRIVSVPVLALLGPADGTRVATVSASRALWFRWQSHPLAAGYSLELSSEADFAKVSATRHLTTSGGSLAVGQGKWYWRVRTKPSLPGSAVTSEVRQLVIERAQKVAAPRLLTPDNSSELTARREVSFGWQSAEESADSELQIATDPGFTTRVFTKQVRGGYHRAELHKLVGAYYWRIVDRYAGRSGNWTSEVFRFSVRPQDALLKADTKPGDGSAPAGEGSGAGAATQSGNASATSPPGPTSIRPSRASGPRPAPVAAGQAPGIAKAKDLAAPQWIFPRAGGVIDMTTRENIPFRWSRVTGAVRYQFRLSRGAKVIYAADSKTNSHVFDDLGRLDTGSFACEVDAVDQNGKVATARANFRITLSQTLEKPELNIKR